MRKKKKLQKIREMRELNEKQINQHKTNGTTETESYYKCLGKAAALDTMELLMFVECGKMEDVGRLIGRIVGKTLWD